MLTPSLSFTQPKFPISNILIRPAMESDQPLRIGHGFDIHRLVEDRKLVIGLFKFSHTKCTKHV